MSALKTSKFYSAQVPYSVKYKPGQMKLKFSNKTKVGRAVKGLKKEINSLKPEPTYVQGVISTGTLQNAAPYVQLLNGITTGDTSITRTGQKVNWKSLHMRIQTWADASLLLSTPVRIMIVRESTALGGALSPTQLFGDATPTWDSNFGIARNVPDRYKVYYDKSVIVGPTNAGVALAITGQHDYHIKEINLKFNFITDYSRGIAGTIADIDTNSLTLLVFTDNNIADTIFVAGQFTLIGEDK